MPTRQRTHQILATVACAAVLFVCCRAAAQITIAGPDRINVGAFAQFQITGLPDSDLAGSSVTVEPADGAVVIPARTWGGAPFVLVSPTQPGEFTLTVARNAWVDDLRATAAKVAAAVPGDPIVAELDRLATDAAARFPAAMATVTFIAEGPQPNPTPPIPIPTKIAKFVIVRESGSVKRPEVGQALIRLQTDWAKANPKTPVVIIDPDQVAEPDTPEWLRQIVHGLDGESGAYLVGVDASGAVVAREPLAGGYDEIVGQLEAMKGATNAD